MAKLTGYAIVFGSRSLDLGGFTEQVAPRAVDRALAPGADIRALWNHDRAIVFGRTTAGTLTLAKDARGLRVSIDMPGWAAGYLETIGRSDVSGMSFAFATLADEWTVEPGGSILRTLTDLAISEVSVVSWPAYTGTSVQVARSSVHVDSSSSRPPRGASIDMLMRWHKLRVA